MNRNKVLKYFRGYLAKYNIPYVTTIEDGCMCLTLKCNAHNAPGKYVELCIWFYGEDNAEARVYYSKIGSSVCKQSEYKEELLKLLNFINAKVFLSCGNENGIYKPHMLYTPRMFLTEDSQFDIAITTIVNYDFAVMAPLETADYLTIYCAELLDKLALPIYGVLIGEFTANDAKEYIRKNIICDK